VKVPEDGGRGAGLEVEPDLAGLEEQDAHVRLEVTLAVEERCVAAPLSFQRLDVVRELALEILDGVRALDEQSGPRPGEKAGLLAQRPVLPIQVNSGRDLGHRPIVGSSFPAF
jgi:hypothetical protein